MDFTEILGIIAGACTTLGFVPQVVRVIRLKSAKEISLPFTVSFFAGVILWMIYGILECLIPVIFWNSLSAFLGLLLLLAKIRYG